MATQAELQARLDAIDLKLESGVKSASDETGSVDYDLAELRSQQAYLRSRITAERAKRPTTSRILLGRG